MTDAFVTRTPGLLEAESPERAISARAYGGLGFLLLAVPPTRSFVAVSSDLIQLLVLLGAAAVSVWAVVSAVDATGSGSIISDVVEKTNKAIDKWRVSLHKLFVFYMFTIVALVFAKIVVAWVEPHARFWWIARLSAGIAGFMVGQAIVRTGVMLEVVAHVQFFRGMVASLSRSPKPPLR